MSLVHIDLDSVCVYAVADKWPIYDHGPASCNKYSDFF